MKINKISLFLFITTVYLKYSSADVITKTGNGAVRGVSVVSRKGRTFSAFNGIPYAEPPVGELRFKSPVPKKEWRGTLLANRDGSECLQIQNNIISGSEDCLYINVYTPELKPKSLLPVMAYVHAGAYIIGNSSGTLAGPKFLLDKDIVLVTFNYRLGIFGFLSTGDAAAPGNFGLKDQTMALQWIQENIHNFGGDRNQVTVFGESSGGESVQLLALSEKSKKLFKRYITQSGNALYPRAFATDPSYYDKAKSVAAMFNCDSTHSTSMIHCLKQVNAWKLVNTTSVFDFVSRALSTTWRPTKEPKGKDALLTDIPSNLIRRKKLKDCKLISGTARDDGTLLSLRLQSNKELYQLAVETPIAFIKQLLNLYEPLRGKDNNALAIKLKKYYDSFEVPRCDDPYIYRYTLFATDFLFLYPQIQLLMHLRETSKEPFYSYLFAYRGALSRAIPLNNVLGNKVVSHNDDTFYIFPLTSQEIGPQYHISRTQNDYKMVDQMIDLWTSFAMNSVPISNQVAANNSWLPYTTDTYLEIGNIFQTTSTRREHDKERLKFLFENVPPYNLKDDDENSCGV